MSDAKPDAKPHVLPGMPYTVRELQFGPHMRPTRLYANGHYGDILTDEEIAVYDVVQRLAAAAPPPFIDPALTAAFCEYIGEAPAAAKAPKNRRSKS